MVTGIAKPLSKEEIEEWQLEWERKHPKAKPLKIKEYEQWYKEHPEQPYVPPQADIFTTWEEYEGWQKEHPEWEFRPPYGLKKPPAYYVIGTKGWGVSKDYETFVSPEWEKFTLAEMQTKLGGIGVEGLLYDFSRDMFVPATEEQVWKRKEWEERIEAKGLTLPKRIEELPATIEEYNARIAEERARTEQLFQVAFPGTTASEVRDMLDAMVKTEGMPETARLWADQAQDEFLKAVRDIGKTPEMELFLRTAFPQATDEEINALFGEVPVEVPTVVPTKERSKWEDVLNKLWSRAVEFSHQTKQGLFNVLPLAVFSDVKEGQSKVTGMSDKEAQKQGLAYTTEEANQSNLMQRERRDVFRKIAARDREKYEGWVAKHPELKPRAEWEGEILTLLKKDPKLILDPAFIAYIAADSATFMAAFWGATVLVGFITRNPIAGMAAGVIVTTPAQIEDLYQDLLQAGAKEEQAAQLAVPVGTLISSVEVMGGLAVLRAVGALPGLKPFYDTFRRGLQKEVAKAVLTTMAKRGLISFTEIELSEIFEEIIQGAIQNALVKTFDESREVLAGIKDTVLRTFISVFPLALIGGGANVRLTYNQMTTQQSQKVEADIKTLKDAGLPAPQAKLIAVTNFAETPEGQEVVKKAMEQAPEVPAFPEEAAKKAREAYPLKPPITGEDWVKLSIPDRVELVKSLGMEGKVASKSWDKLTDLELRNLTTEMVEKVTPVTPEVTDEVIASFGGIEGTKAKIVELEKSLDRPRLSLQKKIDNRNLITQLKERLSRQQVQTTALPKAAPGMPEEIAIGDVITTKITPLGVPLTIGQVIGEGTLGKGVATTPAWKIRTAPGPKGITAIPKDAARILVKKGVEVPTAPPIVEEVAPAPPPEIKQTEFVNEYVESKGQKLPPPPIEPPPASTQFPSDMPASQQVANHISFDPDKVGLGERFLRGKNKAISQWIDKLYPIDTFVSEAKKFGVELSIEENPYIQARMLEGITSKSTTFLEDGTFGREFWKMEKGKAVPNFKGESLTKILESVKEPEAWRDFSTYLTSLRANELNELGIKTGITADVASRAITELEAKNPNFSKLANKIQKYQSDLLDYIQESGLISPELRETLKAKYYAYVPFHRVLEELQGKGYMGKKMVGIASPIKRIKGSEREIINPLESIVKNTYAFINAADRNQVGVAMARLVNEVPELQGLFEPIKTPIAKVANVTAKELGIDVAGLSDEAAEGVFNIFRPSMFTKENVATVMIDGKKQFFKVDPDLNTALTAMDTANMGILWKILSSPAKWLRAGATLSPDFMIRNPVRDAMSAMVYSNYGFIPGVDTLRGVAHILRKDSVYKLYKLSGAEHSMLVSLDREYLTKSFKEIVEGKKFTDYVKHPLELLQILSELGEKATRLGEFAKGIKSGATPITAGFSSREVTLDFAKAGTQAKAVNRIIAFFNANIRGWDRMVTGFKEHPIRTSFKVLAGITLPSILLWVINHDDDRWKEIPQWQKDLFWIVMTDKNIYRIPKPFELGVIFGSGPERLLDYLDSKDPDMAKKFIANLLQAGTPGWLPTGLEPIIENITNHSFFKGTPIVSQALRDLPPELQYTTYTSEVAKGMGRLLKQSPMKIDNILYGWTGGLGRYATEAIDKLLEKTGIVAPKIEPSPTLADLPVIRAFIVRNPIGGSSESVNTFYDELESYTSLEKLLKGLIEDKKQAEFDKEKANHPELLFAYDNKTDTFYSASARYLRRVSGELSDIRKLQNKVYKSTTMTPEQKRELIDALDTIKTDMAIVALQLLRNPSKEVSIFEVPASEIEAKLGTTTGSPLSPDVTKMTDITSDLAQSEGDSPLKKLLKKNNTALVIIADLPDTSLYQIDRAVTKAGLTRRQNELLDQYDATPEKEKKAFLELHPELKENPKAKWLRDNPESNAILALWGNSKLLTQKAYDIAVGLVASHDIPDNALEERVLPPKDLAKPYFELMEAKEKWGDSSWEAKLILVKNPKLTEWNTAWTLPDTPLQALELKVKHRDLFDLIDSYSDKESAGYIADDKAREDAIKKLKADNPEWVDDTRRIEAIENKAPDTQTTEAWVERGKLIDQFGGGSSEAKVWLIDHPDIHGWALEQKLLEDDGTGWNVPVLRINVKWRVEDKEYNDNIPAKFKNITNLDERADKIAKAREDYLAKNIEYNKDRYRREAYSYTGPAPTYKKFPADQIETFVQWNTDASLKRPASYYEKLAKYNKLLTSAERESFERFDPDFAFMKDYWYEDTWWLQAHPKFVKTMVDIGLWLVDAKHLDFSKTPTREVLGKYRQYYDLIEGKPRDDFRWELWQSGFKDFEVWGVLKFGWIPIEEKRRRAKLTQTEKVREQFKKIEELLK